jgi:hypothetical protein
MWADYAPHAVTRWAVLNRVRGEYVEYAVLSGALVAVLCRGGLSNDHWNGHRCGAG